MINTCKLNPCCGDMINCNPPEQPSTRRALASPAPQPTDEIDWLDKDAARLALWQAIQAIKIGNPTDDKLILDNLHKAGIRLARINHNDE